MAMDNHEITFLVLFDLSVTIDYQIHLNELKNDFAITALALDWFAYCLSDRMQRVLIVDQSAGGFRLNCSVPQRSCLGPVLFTLYYPRLYHVIANHLPPIHGYANDTQLYLLFRPDSGLSQYRALAAIESCISDVRVGLLHKRLLTNDSTTEFLIVGSRQQLSKNIN